MTWLIIDTLKKIAIQEEKNSDLKRKRQSYYHKGLANWQAFKLEFNHEKEELRKIFADFKKK